MDEKDKNDQKEIALYSVELQAWLNSKFELDKSLMTLGLAGIGFLIAIAEKLSTCAQLFFTALGMLCFLMVIFLILYIFHKNPSQIEAGLKNQSSEEFSKIEFLLCCADFAAKIFFFVGVAFSVIVGILYIFKG